MIVECDSKVESHPDASGKPGPLIAAGVREWLEGIPDGATIYQIVRDFGSQRDPDERLVGLRAEWSEVRQ